MKRLMRLIRGSQRLLGKKRIRLTFVCVTFSVVVLTLCTLLYIKMEGGRFQSLYNEMPEGAKSLASQGEGTGESPTSSHSNESQTHAATDAPSSGASGQSSLVRYGERVEMAKRLAAGCQYEEAVGCITAIPDYENEPELSALLNQWADEQSSLVEWDVGQTTHIFFHSLIAEPKKAFDGDYKAKGYNDYMATVSEFNKILEIMYQKGYMLVTPHQLATYQRKGDGGKEMARRELRLPKGKKAFLLSIDDVSYYQYMDGDGFASRLVIDENGNVVNEMNGKDGVVQRGDFDVVPLLERFIWEHPDFSYQGARGIVALTGYDGVLGYRTSKSQHKQDEDFLDAHPDYDYLKECEAAKAVAEAMKEKGWLFANHSFSHNNIGQKATKDKQPLSYAGFKQDIHKWRTEVEPILGKTDIIIFPQGTYLNEPGRSDWEPYAKGNKRYQHLLSQGIRYFFGVGGYQPWVQITDEYFRQDRINIDGLGMRTHPKLYKPFFDPQDVYDSVRP